MKNIHLIPTDKPSRLGYLTKKGKEVFKDLRFFDAFMPTILDGENQNVYITNDEVIKDGEYQLYNPLGNFDNAKVSKAERLLQNDGRRKKIILTTDPDLIKDGVQAIDDEFLEWFVKNPSCEEVKIEKVLVTNSGLGHQEYAVLDSSFKVIEINAKIPQTSYSLGKVTILDSYEYVVDYKIIIPKEEPKDETLEEAAKRLYPHIEGEETLNAQNTEGRIDFIAGAEWQAERMYSEEEVKDLLIKALTHKDNGEVGNLVTVQSEIRTANFYTWFEQFKKK